MTAATIEIDQMDPECAREIAEAEKDRTDAEQVLAEEAKRPWPRNDTVTEAEVKRQHAVLRITRANARAARIHEMLHPLSDLERARVVLAAAEADVEDWLARPATKGSTDQLLAARDRRARAQLVVERQEQYEAELAAAAVARAALIEQHSDRIEELRGRLVAARAALATALRDRHLTEVSATCDAYNQELAKVHDQLVALDLLWWSDADMTGGARRGDVYLAGEAWVPVVAEKALLWCAEQVIVARAGRVPALVEAALTSVVGRGSGGFAARNVGLMAAIDGKLSRGRGRPTGPQAA